MTKSDGGKGSSPRPFSVSNEEYANRWDAIFGKDKQESPLQKLYEVEKELGIHWTQEGCKHNIWTHDSVMYVCKDCGMKAEKPFVAK